MNKSILFLCTIILAATFGRPVFAASKAGNSSSIYMLPATWIGYAPAKQQTAVKPATARKGFQKKHVRGWFKNLFSGWKFKKIKNRHGPKNRGYSIFGPIAVGFGVGIFFFTVVQFAVPLAIFAFFGAMLFGILGLIFDEKKFWSWIGLGAALTFFIIFSIVYLNSIGGE